MLGTGSFQVVSISGETQTAQVPALQRHDDGNDDGLAGDGGQLTVARFARGYSDVWVLLESGDVFVPGEDQSKENRDDGVAMAAVNQLRVAEAASSGRHWLVVNDEQRLYAFGENGAGQLGLGHVRERAEGLAEAVPSLAERRVVAVACGAEHSVAVSVDGDVYTWGAGDQGQLGRGRSVVISPVPRALVHLDAHIVSVACGDAFCAALSDDGRVFVWGSGLTRKRLYEPVQLDVEPVTQLAAGYSHLVLLTKSNRVCALGMGLLGQLGFGVVPKQDVPRVVEAFDEVEVLAVACGPLYTAVVCRDGVWAFGKGHGAEPRRVASLDGAYATRVSCTAGGLVAFTPSTITGVAPTALSVEGGTTTQVFGVGMPDTGLPVYVSFRSHGGRAKIVKGTYDAEAGAVVCESPELASDCEAVEIAVCFDGHSLSEGFAVPAYRVPDLRRVAATKPRGPIEGDWRTALDVRLEDVPYASVRVRVGGKEVESSSSLEFVVPSFEADSEETLLQLGAELSLDGQAWYTVAGGRPLLSLYRAALLSAEPAVVGLDSRGASFRFDASGMHFTEQILLRVGDGTAVGDFRSENARREFEFEESKRARTVLRRDRFAARRQEAQVLYDERVAALRAEWEAEDAEREAAEGKKKKKKKPKKKKKGAEDAVDPEELARQQQREREERREGKLADLQREHEATLATVEEEEQRAIASEEQAALVQYEPQAELDYVGVVEVDGVRVGSAGEHVVWLCLNGADWVRTGVVVRAEAPTVSALVPRGAPVDGGSTVRVEGEHMFRPASLVLGGASAKVEDGFTCSVPGGEAGEVQAAVEFGDGVRVEVPGGFVFYEQPSGLEFAACDEDGRWRVFGEGIVNLGDGSAQVRFDGNVTVPAEVVEASASEVVDLKVAAKLMKRPKSAKKKKGKEAEVAEAEEARVCFVEVQVPEFDDEVSDEVSIEVAVNGVDFVRAEKEFQVRGKGKKKKGKKKA